jgi:hypothetical protein
MRKALGYFYVTDSGLYYISVELTARSEKRKFYRVIAYDVEAGKFLYNDIVPAKSVERLEKALLKLVESVQPSEVSKRKKAR